ncbi:MAG: hypothetical protein AABM64_09555 [Pseudomonadota bacterium]
MHSDLRILLAVSKWGRRLLAFGAMALAAFAAISSYTSGLRAHDVVLLGLWALLLGSLCAWVILKIGDRLIGGIEQVKEGRRVATLLTEWRAVNNPAIRLDALVCLWLEKAPDNKIIRQIRENTLLRTLKAAVRQGLIQRHVKDEPEVSATTLCDVDSAAEFFAKAKWLSVKPEPAGLEPAQVPAGITIAAPHRARTVRSSWIWGHRDPWR